MSQTNQPAQLPMIERRRIEANILKFTYDVLKQRHGLTEAQAVIAETVRQAAIAQGQDMARTLESNDSKGPESLQDFADILPLWTMDNALELDMIQHTDKVLDFNVTRCRYAELYREMGLAEIGHLLSCQRDGSFCEGFDPKLTMQRSQTIMQGATHCDFRYCYQHD